MIIADRLRELRKAKGLSQGYVEQRSGLLRCYLSRLENGHTVPSIATLQILARTLDVRLHEFFFNGDRLPELPAQWPTDKAQEVLWGHSGRDARYLEKLRTVLGRISDRDR